MKRILAIVLCMVLACGLFAGCTPNNPDTPDPVVETYEIALVTDVGNIDDQSFNQGAWEGVVAYAEANSKTFAYYRPTEDSTESRVESIKAAIDKGAKVVVCPGYLFEDAIYEVQESYPETMFLLLDGQPHTADYSTYFTAPNVHCILYKEEQAGYFAGYAAVKDGYKSLGFLGGQDVPAVIRFGFGFVQGANDAAVELEIVDEVSIKYWYAGGFAPTDEIASKMNSWYTDGTEIVFSCGGGIYLSALSAAEAANGKVIGVDVDQSSISPLIVTSAMKGLTNSVVLALTDLYTNGGTWSADFAGATENLGVESDCVGLPTAADSWRFETYTVEEYETLFAAVKAGEVEISNATDVAPEVEIAVDYAA